MILDAGTGRSLLNPRDNARVIAGRPAELPCHLLGSRVVIAGGDTSKQFVDYLTGVHHMSMAFACLSGDYVRGHGTVGHMQD